MGIAVRVDNHASHYVDVPLPTEVSGVDQGISSGAHFRYKTFTRERILSKALLLAGSARRSSNRVLEGEIERVRPSDDIGISHGIDRDVARELDFRTPEKR